jgi:glyceraldehyde-3-phosphate dehydrogenase/erythrose-4-phosphate dehydrogenase
MPVFPDLQKVLLATTLTPPGPVVSVMDLQTGVIRVVHAEALLAAVRIAPRMCKLSGTAEATAKDVGHDDVTDASQHRRHFL